MWKQIRDINLSYNLLDFAEEGSEDFINSTASMDNLRQLLKKAKLMNHINVSGMNICRSELITFCKQCMASPLLMSIHLNDNGITKKVGYFTEILDLFELKL